MKIRYKLDIQEFILEYTDQFGGLQQLTINRLKIDSVFMNHCTFIRNKYDEIKNDFLQVVHEDNVSCYFTLKKEYRFKNSGIEIGHEYSDEIVTSYLVKDGKSFVFANKISFLRIFPADKRSSIKQFIKDNRIKVKRRIKSDMINLCIYCNKLNSI